MNVRSLLRRLRLRSRQTDDKSGATTSADKVDDASVDAEANDRQRDANLASATRSVIPPGYVKSYDEGRPPH
jgi:hypothetical protein